MSYNLLRRTDLIGTPGVFIYHQRYHRLTFWASELASFTRQFTSFCKSGNALIKDRGKVLSSEKALRKRGNEADLNKQADHSLKGSKHN